MRSSSATCKAFKSSVDGNLTEVMMLWAVPGILLILNAFLTVCVNERRTKTLQLFLLSFMNYAGAIYLAVAFSSCPTVSNNEGLSSRREIQYIRTVLGQLHRDLYRCVNSPTDRRLLVVHLAPEKVGHQRLRGLRDARRARLKSNKEPR